MFCTYTRGPLLDIGGVGLSRQADIPQGALSAAVEVGKAVSLTSV